MNTTDLIFYLVISWCMFWWIKGTIFMWNTLPDVPEIARKKGVPEHQINSYRMIATLVGIVFIFLDPVLSPYYIAKSYFIRFKLFIGRRRVEQVEKDLQDKVKDYPELQKIAIEMARLRKQGKEKEFKEHQRIFIKEMELQMRKDIGVLVKEFEKENNIRVDQMENR